ncbi:HindVP family restriction endonuclease [Planktothrix pseudagardhii]|uniref:Type-2 restriction enzyme HgiDI n=1 Tax=Planktothrix pseudagardhii TaxID=132604 RepID=A0A9W4D4S0_9CYAN|nr:HindVP family restriction endonuclease [Planktothrix pseudagardhii]CAD5946285.1 Type-2 restriction enzyme HgiDI [Planktothrix pseudagardhii]
MILTKNNVFDVETGLFGLERGRSNRDFSKEGSWGKNKFNNAFPVSLSCYMARRGLKLVYLKLDTNTQIKHEKIDVSSIFGLDPFASELFFSFETDFTPYRTIVTGKFPRTDLVTLNKSTKSACWQSLEVKLTALPDNSTYKLPETQYGCEIVVRPTTIIYLALGIAYKLKDSPELLLDYLDPTSIRRLSTWWDVDNVISYILDLANDLDRILISVLDLQEPFVLQPVWKTIGRTAKLHENCLDIFVWSDFAFTRLFFNAAREALGKKQEIDRYGRSIIWLSRMLLDFALEGRIPHADIIKTLAYNAQTDKAFALNGANTNRYMACTELTSPRIKKDEIKNIVLGGGQNFLSPERRFDAALLSNPELFN